MLIAARFVQGAGGALTSAVVLGMIVTMFPQPREQAKALGVYGFVASAGGSIGLLAGGVLTDALDWHWIFLINAPIGIAVGVLALRLVEAKPGLGVRAGADLPGAALLTGGVMVGVYAVLGVAEHGWASQRTLGLAAVSAVALAVFLVRQARIATPLMPLRLFASRDVTGANLVMALLVVGMFSLFFLGALYLQLVLGLRPAGRRPRVPALDARDGRDVAQALPALRAAHDPRAELLLIVAGLLLFARTPVDGSLRDRRAPGHDPDRPRRRPLDARADDARDVGREPEDAGLASGLVNTTVQVGGAIGLAVLATLAAGRTGASTAPEALLSGYHLAFLVGAGVLLAATVVALWLSRPSALRVFGVRDVIAPDRV